jgi:hypothetical protein
VDDVTRLIVTVGLLGGPTIAALIYWRVMPGHRTRKVDGISLAGSTAPVVFGDGGWACPSCLSLNRSQTKRCYHCGRARDAATAPEGPLAAPGSGNGMVPGASVPASTTLSPAAAMNGTPVATASTTAVILDDPFGAQRPAMTGIPITTPFPVVGDAVVRCPLLQLARAGSPGAPARGGATCLAGSEPTPITASYRNRYCVTAAYHHCLRYQVATAVLIAPGGVTIER